MKHIQHALASSLLGLCFYVSVPMHAATINALSPQGEIAKVRQITVKFDEAMVPFGDPNAPAPLTMSCSPQVLQQGQGRWVDEKIWVYDFSADLPAGVQCQLNINKNLKSVAGHTYSGEQTYDFNTGGPFVTSIRPWESATIAEDQAFALTLNGQATKESLEENMWCDASDRGELIPVQILEGQNRDAILEKFGWAASAKETPTQYWVVQCQQRLSPNSTLKLLYNQGVASPSGIANSVQKIFKYYVREELLVSFSCTRENADTACMPLDSMTLSFSSPIPIELAQKIELKTTDSASAKSYPPVFRKEETASGFVSNITFPAPLPEQTSFTIQLPDNIKDDSGRSLQNAEEFPLKVATAPMPALAKFASAPFGIVELYASPDEPPLVPITVRRVENLLPVKDRSIVFSTITNANLNPETDEEIIHWIRALERFNEGWIRYDNARKFMPQAIIPRASYDDYVETRQISLLGNLKDAKKVDLPASEDGPDGLRPFEVIGIPVKEPGYHVLEVASQALGDALLSNPQASNHYMYVRTGVLVTNLGVHAKIGRENSLVWVTSLDQGLPVANADISIRGCSGEEYFTGKTDQDGLVRIENSLPEGSCPDRDWERFLFISARIADPKSPTGKDMAFTLSTWNRGIEYWRFNFPTDFNPLPDTVTATVFDRTLLRAGETVSMKHFIRDLRLKGFAIPDWSLPDEIRIEHVGSGQEIKLPITWSRQQGGLSATSEFEIPKTAKLGIYRVYMNGGDTERYHNYYSSGTFQVEEFRLPVFEGQISLNLPDSQKTLVQPKEVPLGLQINFLSGGGAANLPVKVSAVVRNASLSFKDYPNFSFASVASNSNPYMYDYDEDDESMYYYEEDNAPNIASSSQKLIADKLPLTLDAQGVGAITLKDMPTPTQPLDLLVEASFADPNGEVVTLQRNDTLWPAAIVAGIRNDEWVSIKNQKTKLQAIALDANGKPQKDIPLSIKAQQRTVISIRKRLVGGFYSYDSKTDIKDLGTVCEGLSDENGLLECEYPFTESGNISLIAQAKDAQGRIAQAATSLWVTTRDELWFGGSDSDRIDLLPEKPEYRAGDIAKFQIRMPFRNATALVTVEREGILESHVMPISGDNPTIELKVGENWGPNVYVSAIVLRGRLQEVPMYTFFDWGYKKSDQWWQDFEKNLDYVPPSAMVDLSKPAYRLGVAKLRINDPAYGLKIEVQPQQNAYQIRSTAKAVISVKLPDGSPAANADVAVAVVDEALLELKSNTSWNLLSNMLVERSWGVRTATAQMEIIGRRHYGRKALPAGGGGGGSGSSSRELFDTLLLWKPHIKLDDNGQATIDIPLNDSLTTFRIVAIATQGASRFGTSWAKIQSTQDLQLISGLPPVVRSDDQYRAAITVRNATNQAMQVKVTAKSTGMTLPPLMLEIPANTSQEAVWDVTVPAELAGDHEGLAIWEINAQDLKNGSSDAIKITQRIRTGVPITVRQATLKQLDGEFQLSVAPPSDGLPGRGGVQISMVARLAEGLPAIKNWFERYPYICLEQQVSVNLGTRNINNWKKLMQLIPTYLDEDGLAYYYPPASWVSHRGSDILTAYILSSADEAAKLYPELALEQGNRDRMLAGLTLFVEGKLKRDYWSPRKDLDIRKLAAMEALSRYGKFTPRMLGSITIAPNQWPTTSVIDWLQILQRTPKLDNRDKRLQEAMTILRSRLNTAGTRLGFSTDQDDYWWWLMWNGDVNAARLLLATLDEDNWQEDLPKLVNGFIARQQNGSWHTTTANLWGSFALEAFSRKFESEPVSGWTQAQMVDATSQVISKGEIDWSKVVRIDSQNNIGSTAPGANRAFGAPTSPASFANNSIFLQWPTPPQQTTVIVKQDGTGRPWATVQSLAAVPLQAPFSAGYSIKKTITPIDEQVKGEVRRGDIWRVHIDVDAQTDMTWVVINDPIPGGATIMGSGLGRDSEIALTTTTPQEESTDNYTGAWLAYQERAQDAFRAYYEYVPKGKFSIEYTVRLNNEGTFILPPTRVEALYAPEMFGELPNANVTIMPAKTK